jgi:hypothetical protein
MNELRGDRSDDGLLWDVMNSYIRAICKVTFVRVDTEGAINQ